MNRQDLINKLKTSNLHIWSKIMAGQEEIFVEGRIENFEKYLDNLISEVLWVLSEHDQLRSKLTSNILLEDYFNGTNETETNTES